MRLNGDNILLVGDQDHHMRSAVARAMPPASITSVPSVFDAIAELHAGMFDGVLVNTLPLEARPEAATRALREAAGEGRIVLWTDAAREPLSRRLLDIGADDYVVAPADPDELQRTLGPKPRNESPTATADVEQLRGEVAPVAMPDLPLAEIVLTAMLEHPQRALDRAVEAINQRLLPAMHIVLHGESDPVPAGGDGRVILSQALRDTESCVTHQLILEATQPIDSAQAQQFLAYLASVLSMAQQIDARQARLQKLAITDELTGIYNARYFRHFLARMIEKARQRRFPVTLLLFDIDNFKKYNDTFGHGVGDDILKQTASLMKRCSRDHDLVARISGDEFAVIFWEKEGPRQPYDQHQTPGRLPSTPMQIADRFRKLLSKNFTEFNQLGAAGQGVLTISGGMAVYPYDARTPEELIEAADKALMFGAKKGGKNSIYLVGDEEIAAEPTNAPE